MELDHFLRPHVFGGVGEVGHIAEQDGALPAFTAQPHTVRVVDQRPDDGVGPGSARRCFAHDANASVRTRNSPWSPPGRSEKLPVKQGDDVEEDVAVQKQEVTGAAGPPAARSAAVVMPAVALRTPRAVRPDQQAQQRGDEGNGRAGQSRHVVAVDEVGEGGGLNIERPAWRQRGGCAVVQEARGGPPMKTILLLNATGSQYRAAAGFLLRAGANQRFGRV